MSALTLALTVLPAALPPPEPWEPPDQPAHHDVGRDLLERDTFGTFPNVHVADRVVIKWGDAVEIEPLGVEQVAAAFEDSWTLFVDERGMEPPVGSDTWLLNVYIGNTGAPAPSIGTARGYFTTDDLGAPMIVLQPDRFEPGEPTAWETATHELFHALQHAERGRGGAGWTWFTEASATWAQEEVWDPARSAARRLPSYATTPYRAIHVVDDSAPDWQLGVRHYGAFLLPRFLTERLDEDVVVDTLRGEGTALDALSAAVAAREGDLPQLFGDFAAANATWDYSRGDLYAMVANAPVGATGYAVDAPPRGWPEWVSPPSDRRPEAWGWDLVRIPNPEPGVLRARFVSHAPCGVDAWVHIVKDTPGGPVRTPLVEGQRVGSADLEVGTEPLAISIAFTGAASDPVDYQLFLEVSGASVPEVAVPGHDPGSCGEAAEPVEPRLGAWSAGCTHVPPPGAVGSGTAGFSLVLAALLRRRRRA